MMCQHFFGHKVKQILVVFRSPLAINSYWPNEFVRGCKTPAARQESRSSRPRELPPQALTEPYVRLSPHTALHVPCKLPSLRKSLVPPISG